MFQIHTHCPKCKTQLVTLDKLDETYDFPCPTCGAIALHIQKIIGFIYILSNELMPGVVKIGYTERSVPERIAELSGHTGVGLPYKEEASFPVTNPPEIERIIHGRLNQFRINQNREFFRIPVAEAIALVREILGLTLPSQKTHGSTKTIKLSSGIRVLLTEELKAQGTILGGFGSDRYERK